MLAELLNSAKAAHLGDGDCLEVHTDGDDANVIGVCPVGQFLESWGYAMGMDVTPPVGRWLGLVHEDGALLAPVGD